MPGASLTVLRATLKTLPAPLRERFAARLFMTNRDHGERPREAAWRARGQEVRVGGMAGVAFGDGPAVLLMHGWEGRGLQLSAWIEPLLARGRRVIALDAPGHGRTPGIGGLPNFAAGLGAAIEEVAPVAIVAHSIGSAASIVAASRTGYPGKVLCLAGPPETEAVFTRARAFMGLPDSGRERFRERLAGMFDARTDDLDIGAAAKAWGGDLCAVLADGDDDVPVDESRAIVAGAGGEVVVVEAGHRSVMWDPAALEAGSRFLD